MPASAARASRPASNPFPTYPTYRFRANEQDPVVDQLQTLVEDDGRKISQIALVSGISTSTYYNLFTTRQTRRPRYTTIVATARAVGYDLAFVPAKRKGNGHGWMATPPKIIRRFKVIQGGLS